MGKDKDKKSDRSGGSKDKDKDKKKKNTSKSPDKTIKSPSKTKVDDKDKDKDKDKKKTLKKKESTIPTITNIETTDKLDLDKFNDTTFKPQGFHQDEILSNEKCDGCFEGKGTIFCTNCDKIYCRNCEEQIHLVPANYNHERLSILDVPHLKKTCYLHNDALKFYCETCEEPICTQCYNIGPHISRLHRISNILDSFRKRFNQVYTVVSQNLVFKLGQLVNQTQYIEHNVEKVKISKNSVERTIRSDYNSLIENLR